MDIITAKKNVRLFSFCARHYSMLRNIKCRD
jgi:hypothetical protein